MANGTKHLADCERVFRNYDARCPRCSELAGGAEPRKGWGPSRAERDAQDTREIEAHFASGRHRSGGCGVVCTFGQW